MSDKPTLVLNRANVPLRMARKIPFSHGQQEPPYVINVLSFGRFYAAAASDSHIRLYDKATLALSRVIPPVDSASHLTNMTKSQGPDEALIACYADGKVYLYDLKSQSETPVLTLKGPNGAPCLCAATNSNDNYLASGTELFQHEATIRIHDLRAPQKALHVYADTHSDDVSTLAFHPTIEELLLSGAMDGLISTIDVRIADEDDAILHTANVGASLSRVGWMPLAGKGWQGTFALTNMETLAVYDASDELSVVREYGDIRDIKTQDWETHYVIDCQGTSSGLALFTGTREGGLAVIQAPLQTDTWSLEQVLAHDGHTDIVRGCQIDLTQGTLVSGGEDSMICLWSVPPTRDGEAAGPSTSTGSQLKASNDKTRTARYNPY